MTETISNLLNGGNIDEGTGLLESKKSKGYFGLAPTSLADPTGMEIGKEKTVKEGVYDLSEFREGLTVGVLEEKFITIPSIPREKLYKQDSIIYETYSIMKVGIEHLDNAINDEDELDREHSLDVFRDHLNLVKIHLIKTKISKNLNEAITMLITGLNAERDKVMDLKKIKVLANVYSSLMVNVLLTENQLDEILDNLEESGYNIHAPLSEIHL